MKERDEKGRKREKKINNYIVKNKPNQIKSDQINQIKSIKSIISFHLSLIFSFSLLLVI